MAGLCTNLDLFMKLRSFGDLKNWKALYEFIVNELPNEISEEDEHNIKEFLRLFVLHLRSKWQDSSRTLKTFIDKHKNWLERDIGWPDCQSINLRTVLGVSNENLTEDPEFAQIEALRPSATSPDASTSTQKPFEDLSNRQKKRRSGSLAADYSEEELLYSLCFKLKENGKTDLAKAVEDLVKNFGTAIPETHKRTVSSEVVMPDDKALALCTAISLSKWQYLTLRTLLMKEGSYVLPSYHKITSARKMCYPAADSIEVTENGASIRLQALLDHTIQRILQNFGPVPDNEELKLIWKWGLDGSSTQSNYKQKFSESEFDESSVVMTSAVPLRLVGNQTETVMWENPCPGSTSYCRPVKFHFRHETAEFIKEVESDMQRQIEELVPTIFGNTLIRHEMHMTMIDGKVSNIIADVPSSATCPICLAKPSEMNDLGLLDTKPVRESIYKHGISSLHMKIRCMECLLHISYNMDFERWSARGPFKSLKEAKKAATQKEFREQTGLLIDVVKQGFGTTNDGNTARRFFQDYEKSSQITGIDENLIFRFSVILQAISSGKKIDVNKFKIYCRETAELYVHLYAWYYMPTSVHKLLMHGAEICNYFSVLPIGIMSEEASEARNKDFRNVRQKNTRKMNRVQTNEDILHGLLISSDPHITQIRPKYSKKSVGLCPEAVELLQEDTHADSFEEDEVIEMEPENISDPLL